MNFSLENARVGIIGLGYVGLPLAVEFGKKSPTIGFDINQARIDELSAGRDSTLECSDNELAEAKYLSYTSSLQELKECNVYIVTVPTPIDEHKQPDLTPLIKASEALGTVVNQGDIIVYESTVYPGATEEDCIPVVERVSGLKFNQDFFAGYSPERINPGDKENRLTTIKKVTSGSTEEVANFVDDLYNSIILAGTHRASSIKVAEASKVIENVQRDVNIALINELHQIFERLGIDTKEVIEAAATKWNFMKLMPGLVGGHCIGVDPYYLLHKSNAVGYVPDLMRTAREVNDTMASYLASSFITKLIQNKINPITAKVVLLGFTFKENCPDLRNTKVINLYNELVSLGLDVDVYDPWANHDEAFSEYGINLIDRVTETYDASFVSVGHREVIDLTENLESRDKLGFIYDFKGLTSKK